MQDNQEAILAFPVQHSVFISPDQSEIEQIDEIELTPHIQIKETDDEVIVSGYLKLEGKYAGKPPKFPDITLDGGETKVTGFVDSVVFNPFAMDPDDFESDSELTVFKEKIPVHIRIARDKIEDIEQVYASVVTFDYEIQSARKLAVTAELALNGVKSEAAAPSRAEPVSEFPLSLDYVALRNAEEEEEEPSEEHQIIEDVEEEPVVDVVKEESLVEPEVELAAWKKPAPESQPEHKADEAVQKEPVSEKPAEPKAEAQPESTAEPVTRKETEAQKSAQPKAETQPEPESKAEPVIWKAAPAAEPAAPQAAKEPEATVHDDRKEEEKEAPEQPKAKEGKSDKEPPVEAAAPSQTEEKPAEEEGEEEEKQEEQEEKQEEAKVSITLKGTKRDPVTVTSSLLSSYAEHEEKQTAEPAETGEVRSQEEREAEESIERTAAEHKEGALYLTSFMKQEEESFTRMKMCIAQKDETLDGIAEKYSVSPADIALANGLHTNATVAKGQVLYIPVKS